jgi:hypothetical protein
MYTPHISENWSILLRTVESIAEMFRAVFLPVTI